MIEATLELNKVNEIAPDEDTIVFNDEGKVETYYIQRFPNGTIMVGDLNSPYHTELREDGMYVVSEDGVEFSHFNKDGFEIGGKYGKLQGTNNGIQFVNKLVDGTDKMYFAMDVDKDGTTEKNALTNYPTFTYEGTTLTVQPKSDERWVVPIEYATPNFWTKGEFTFRNKTSGSTYTRTAKNITQVNLDEWEWDYWYDTQSHKYINIKKAIFTMNPGTALTPDKYELPYAYIFWDSVSPVLRIGSRVITEH